MKATGKGLLAVKEPIVNRTRNRSKITKNNTEKIGQNIVRLWAWYKETEKLETSLVLSTLYTLYTSHHFTARENMNSIN